MKNILIGFFAIFILGSVSGQCTADFDFGSETYGSYNDIEHQSVVDRY